MGMRESDGHLGSPWAEVELEVTEGTSKDNIKDNFRQLFVQHNHHHKSEGMINWAPCDLSNLAASVASDYCAQLTH